MKNQGEIIQEYQNNQFVEKDNNQKVRLLLTTIENKIVEDLCHQITIIPLKEVSSLSSQKPFAYHKFKQSHSSANHIALKCIRDQKQAISQQLHHLEHQQKRQVKDIRSQQTSQSPEHKKIKHNRSQITTQDLKNLNLLTKNYKAKQRNLQNKLHQFEQLHVKHEKHQRQILQEQQRERSQQKRNKIQKRIENMKNKREERIRRFQEQKKIIGKIKKEKKLYEQLQEKYQKAEKQEEENRIKKYQERQSLYNRNTDIQTLKQHQQKYFQILHKNRQLSKLKKMQQIKVNQALGFNSSNTIHQTNPPERSRFYTQILQEQKKIKQMKNQKYQHVKDLYDKRKQYSDSVKINHVPKINNRLKTEQQDDEVQKRKVKKALDCQQRNKLGLLNLSKSKSLANKSKQSNNETTLTATPIVHHNNNIKKYPNYLRNKNNKTLNITASNNNHNRTLNTKSEISFARELKQAKNIMKKTDFTQKQKVQRVRIIAQKMDLYADNKNIKDQTYILVKKVAAKISLLENLQ